MQKIPEASDRNWGTHAQRKRTIPTKGEISFSFSSDQWSDNTLLNGGGYHVFVFRRRIG